MLLHSVSNGPARRCLERWLCEGTVDDPFEEFMVQENLVRAACSLVGVQ